MLSITAQESTDKPDVEEIASDTLETDVDSGFTVLSLPGQEENQEVTNEGRAEGTHQTAKDNNDEITWWYMY